MVMCRSFDDIMAAEEPEDQKIRENARIALNRVSSDDKVIVHGVCVCVICS